jgi:acyl-CoA oxidase
MLNQKFNYFNYLLKLYLFFFFKDGTYKKSVNDKLTYGTMIFVRVVIVRDLVCSYVSKAAIIATRYSCVRRQSELKPG